MRVLRAAAISTAVYTSVVLFGCKPPDTPSYDEPDAAPAENAPSVVFVTPDDGAVDVNRRPVIRVGFDRQLDARTLKTYSCSLESGDTGRWLTSYYDPLKKEIVIWPAGYLLRRCTWVFKLERGLTDQAGIPVTPGVVTSFRTGDDLIYETPYRKRSYKEDIAPIFETHCTSCHGGAEPLAGLKLDSEDGIATTAISQPSFGRQDLDLIEPTQPGLSLLLYKLIDDGSTPGVVMPRSIDDQKPGAPLSDQDKEALVDWITMGADFFDPEDTDQ